jgi:very-short-patch-repair endonuclease
MDAITRVSPKTFARRLRRNATIAEKTLWMLLRDRQLVDFKFRRQHAIGPYFADFVCVKEKLVIECDGVTHSDRAMYDHARDQMMFSHGYRVLRFSDERVLGNSELVIAEIRLALGFPSPPAPSPT